jgi:hypothetical protein
VALIELETFISAPPERCFDLALSVELHLDSTVATRERAIVDALVLAPHFSRFLTGRNDLIKRAAEGRTSRYDVGHSRA